MKGRILAACLFLLFAAAGLQAVPAPPDALPDPAGTWDCYLSTDAQPLYAGEAGQCIFLGRPVALALGLLDPVEHPPMEPPAIGPALPAELLRAAAEVEAAATAYRHTAEEIDRLLGWVPMAFGVAIAAIVAAIVWTGRQRRFEV